MRYDGDSTDFSHQVGMKRGPNDFFSYYISDDESKKEVILYGSQEGWKACIPYIAKQLTMPVGNMIMVNLKPGVNLRDVRDAMEPGSVGFNRKVHLA